MQNEKCQKYFHEMGKFRKMRKFRENIFVKFENFVKVMSVLAAKINCSKKLVEFSALIAQYSKDSLYIKPIK